MATFTIILIIVQVVTAKPDDEVGAIDMFEEDNNLESYARDTRGSAGTRQRYKNHPRPRRPNSREHQNRRYYQDPRGSYPYRYVDEVDQNGYAAILG